MATKFAFIAGALLFCAPAFAQNATTPDAAAPGTTMDSQGQNSSMAPNPSGMPAGHASDMNGSGASSDNSAAAADPSSAPDKSASGSSSDAGAGKMAHHHHHAKNTSASDNSADKLNACGVNAQPTPEQQNCLKQAENGPS